VIVYFQLSESSYRLKMFLEKQETRQPQSATAVNNADVIADNVLVLMKDIEVIFKFLPTDFSISYEALLQ
jgi:hypothetical protein